MDQNPVLETAEEVLPEAVSPVPEKKKKKAWLWLLLSFLIPFVLMMAAFSLCNVYPFGVFTGDAEHPLGNEQMLNFDLWHQYYPFLQIFQQKLQEGGSMLYSWISGLGTNFVSMIAYYIASPLNLLTLLLPAEVLREALTFGVLIKIGLAGLFFHIFAKKTFGKDGVQTLLFSCLYALCNFATGYYWNVMWLDTFCIFPLVMLGTHELFKSSRFRLYTLTVALSLIMNYYVGYMVCIFVAVSFFAYCFLYKVDLKTFGKKLSLFALFSLLACALSAFITVPAFLGLQSAHGSTGSFPSEFSLYRGFEDLFATLFAFHDPTAIDGLPNIACGLVCVVLLFFYFWNVRISLTEKLTSLAVVVFLLLSLNVNVLDYVWHGFHFPNQVPHRFGFIVSFCLIVLAMRTLSKLDKMDKWDVFGSAVFGILFLAAGAIAVFRSDSPLFTDNLLDGKIILVLNLVLGTFYFLLLALRQKEYVKPEGFAILLCFVMVLELLPATVLGVKAVETTSRSGYTYNHENVHGLIQYAESLNEDPNDFYRMDFTNGWSCNDPALYGYHGVSQFSSAANAGVTTFLHALGLPADEASNRYAYSQNTPITNAFLNLKYLIHKEAVLRDQNYLDKLTAHGGVALYENLAHLPLGFMTEPGLLDLQLDAIAVFQTQNDLFRLATGLNADVIQTLEITYGEDSKGVTLRPVNEEDGGYTANYNYRYDTVEGSQEIDLVIEAVATADGPLYGYVTVPGAENVQLYIGGGLERSVDLEDARVNQHAVYLGEVRKGQEVKLVAKIDSIYINGYCNLQLAVMDKTLFEDGLNRLKDETLTLTHFSDTAVKGVVSTLKGGLLYTSIPYESGWSATVNGEKLETVRVAGAMVGVILPAGQHVVEFSYSPQGFLPGVLISLAALVIFVALCILLRKRPLLYAPVTLPTVPEKPPVEEASSEEQGENDAAEERSEADEETSDSEKKEAAEEDNEEKLPADGAPLSQETEKKED